MEDAATAEISRAQVWQWLHHKATLEGGQTMNVELLSRIVDEEMVRIASEVGAERFANPNFARAKKLFFELSTRDTFEDFLTLPAYEMITSTP